MKRVVVIGSGFGGSIAAARFAEAGHPVTVLELGEDWSDQRKAEQTQDPRYLGRLLRTYPHEAALARPAVTVTQGMGVGGGSLVYSGIHLRAPVQAFAGWPAGYSRAALDPYYERVERRLGVAAMADTFSFDRPRLFAEGARRAGLPEPVALPLAMAGCTRCGWCVPLCAFGKKRTMRHTYLADALATGRVTIHAHRKAAHVALAGAGYRVSAWRTENAEHYHRADEGALETYDGDLVVIAGGAIETPALLERSAGTLRPFPRDQVGERIDGTGDFVQGGVITQRVDAFKGAVMMSGIDRGDYILEDLHGLPIAAAVALDVRLPGIAKGWGRDYQLSLRDYSRRMLGIAVIGKSAPTIRVRDRSGIAEVTGTAYPPPPGALEDARAIIRALGGAVAQTPWELAGRVDTVHPTGGCAMGAVVEPATLQLRGNPGLHVIDGSVLPTGVMRNPSHTICAVAERALDAILAP